MSAVTDVVSLGLLGGILALDRTAVLQTMASRPLVGSTIAGYLLGDPHLGLTCGLLLELLWLMDLPVGASVPPDETLAGVLAAAFAIWAPEPWGDEARAALGVLLAIPFAYLGRMLDNAVRRWNDPLLDRARESVRAGRLDALGRAQRNGILRFLLAGMLATVVGCTAGRWLLASLVPLLPPGTEAALELTEATIPLMGGAAVLAALSGFRSRVLFSAGLTAGLALGHARELWAPLANKPWQR